jgi:multiple sugar transport system permease protein
MISNEKQSLTSKIWEFRWSYIFLAPAFVIYLMFVLWPVLGSVYYSFFEWDGFGNWPEYFIGLRNYIEIFQDKYFWNSLSNTFQYVIFQNIFKLPLSLVIAWILNSKKLRGSNFYRAIFFLPVISSTAIIGIVMTFILSPWNGPVNELLLNFNFVNTPVDFLGSSSYALWMVILVEVWHMSGQYIIYWLAGLQSIPSELYEAAEVDGANSLQSFIYITIPALKPVIIIVTLLGVVNSLKIFDIVQAMTGGGPAFATDVVTTFIYRNAFGSSLTKIGYASAAAILFGIIVMSFGTLQGIIISKVKK